MQPELVRIQRYIVLSQVVDVAKNKDTLKVALEVVVFLVVTLTGAIPGHKTAHLTDINKVVTWATQVETQGQVVKTVVTLVVVPVVLVVLVALMARGKAIRVGALDKMAFLEAMAWNL